MTDDKHHIEITNPELIKRFVEGAMLQNLDYREALGDLVVSVDAFYNHTKSDLVNCHMCDSLEAARKLLASNEEKKDD